MSSTPPKSLAAGGRRLWRSVVKHVELDGHERVLLIEACRTVDQLDVLQAAAAESPVDIDGRPNPALVEARQQRQVLARLIASLRLPDDLEDDDDVARPQRRGAARGPYLRGVS